ncbi:hypothetical protein LA080_006708 [Diaporthe eres]|nr:hypothetical protein LA080_006708 [Diaporthe eres]
MSSNRDSEGTYQDDLENATMAAGQSSKDRHPVAMQLSRYPVMLRLLTQYQNNSLKVFMFSSIGGKQHIQSQAASNHRSPPPMPLRHMRFASQQSSPRQYHAIAIAGITNPFASYQAQNNLHQDGYSPEPVSICRARTRSTSLQETMVANADIQGTLGLDQKAAVPPSHSLDKSETESGDDADAIRERILAERLQTSNPPVLPIMTLLRKKVHKQLDEVATQPSVYDDPSIAQFLTPTARYENLHRFDPEARWTWREELPLINKIDWKITLWACIAFFGLDLDIDVGGIGEDNLIHGHGTQLRSRWTVTDEPDIYPQAIIAGLQLVVDRMDDSDGSPSIPRGKAVVSVSLGIPVDEIEERWGENAYNTFRDTLGDKLNQLNERGVTVVFAAGNDGKGRGEEDGGPDVEPDETTHYADESFPHVLATQDSHVILVGGTDENGRLRPQTSPGRDDHPITIYAPIRLPGYDLTDGETQKSIYGTSFSAPQVAGLAAYLLALPSESDGLRYDLQDPADNTVVIRVKKRLVELAYQRLSDDHKLDAPEDEYDYDIPSVINVAYNGAVGAQTP